MKKAWLAGIGCFGILALGALTIGFWVRGVYNDLVAREQDVSAKWAQVENVYQRRADLVPNLVATVKGYASHEREVLETVTASRAQVGAMQLSPNVLNNPAEFQKFQQA